MYPRIFFFLFPALLASAQDPTPEIGWQAAARMREARYDHCAVSLGDGRVFVAGGMGAGGPLSSAEVYGPGDAFQTVAPMSVARSQHTCTLLFDGRVLVAGGALETFAELYDPVTGGWIPIRGSGTARRGQTATPIGAGLVLLAGGWAADQPTGLLELFNLETESIIPLPATLTVARARHTASVLSDGRVLLSGGTDGAKSLSSTEIFTAAGNRVSAGPPLAQARAGHVAVTLMDGRVLVAGGSNGATELSSAEAYSDGRFAALNAALTIPRQNAFSILIPGSGLVLIGGGESSGRALSDTELFDPQTNLFLVAGSLTAARTRIQGAVLADGVILGTGGQNQDGPSAACGVFAVPRVAFTKAVYKTGFVSAGGTVSVPGETAVVNGSGFTPGRTIFIFLGLINPGTTETIPVRDLITGSVIADSAGRFQANIVTLSPAHAGRRFVLKATPQSTTTITDGTSNTISIGGASQSPSADFLAAADVLLVLDPLPATSVAGAPIPFGVTFQSSSSTMINGNLSIRVGGVNGNFLFSNIAPGAKTVFNFCCVNTPGTVPVTLSYSGDPLHASASLSAPSHTVIARQVQLSASTSLPLFQETMIPVAVSVSPLAPVPTGSITLSKPGTVPQSLPAPSKIPGSVLFPYRATFADKPSSCFTISYSGDSFYPPATINPCFNTTPAVPALSVVTPRIYTYGASSTVDVSLVFPAELGIVNRTVRLEPLGIDVTLSPGVGRATASISQFFPFRLTGITATYSGDLDLSAATAKTAFSMKEVTTQTILAPIASPAVNPLTLVATVSPVIGGSVPAPPAATGIVQFFDGTLFLGQSSLVAQTNGTARATLSNVARPVGARPLKAVYLGSTLFATSTSPIVTVTIQ